MTIFRLAKIPKHRQFRKCWNFRPAPNPNPFYRMNPSEPETPAYPRLNFPPLRLRARRHDDTVEIWDDIRGIYLVLTPEEWVRQHLIAYLIDACGVLAKRVAEEYAVPLNGQPQRADVVVAGDRGEPLLLAECKAPDVPITDRTLAQAVRYNSVLGARWIVLTNGLKHYCWEYTEGRYEQRTGFPDLAQGL